MLLTLLVAFFSLIVLMIVHEFGHFIIAKKFGVKVEEFGIGYPPKLFGKKIGETVYSVNAVPLGAFVKIYGEEGGIDDYRSFANLAVWKRVLIVLGGVAAFWLASIVIFSFLFFVGASVPVGDKDIEGFADERIEIMSIRQDTPAEAAGLLAGDRVVNLKSDTENIAASKIADFQRFAQDNKGKAVAITIDRNGDIFDVNIVPRVSYSEGQGPLGVELERIATVIEKSSWYKAPLKGIIYTWQLTIKAVQGLFVVFSDLITGKGVPSGAELAGPVGITIFLANAASYGAGFFLYFIGSISVFIALFNLFPIPALDGGKLLFLAIEKISKKPVPVKWEQGITMLFFFLLISMSIFVTIKFDVPRLVDFWKASL